jgi:broad specificity phosphatase PhoE
MSLLLQICKTDRGISNNYYYTTAGLNNLSLFNIAFSTTKGHHANRFSLKKRNGKNLKAHGRSWDGPQTSTVTSSPFGVQGTASDEVPTWCWSGSDQFTELDDRKDLPPLPIPSLPGQSRRVVLVRHGQSTWNARSRIQGSSDFSVLTEEGVRQAEAAGNVLKGWNFDLLFASPLKRAAKTAQVVWGARQGSATFLPSLREVDLYSFQGLDKNAGRTAHPAAYDTWQRRPAEFVIDGHWPVRELWHRASLAWQEILPCTQFNDTALVVAHNAVNQALISTALGLTPLHFRRITQTNAAFSVLNFKWDAQGKASVVVERLNYFPDGPLRNEKIGRAGADRLVLVAGSSARSSEVAASLRAVAAGGATTPPLVAVGSAEAQASDVQTALQAVLGTPRPAEGRHVVAVASSEACQLLISKCLGAPGVGSSFTLDEGGVTVFNYHRRNNNNNSGGGGGAGSGSSGSGDGSSVNNNSSSSSDGAVGQGLLLCANFKSAGNS